MVAWFYYLQYLTGMFFTDSYWWLEILLWLVGSGFSNSQFLSLTQSLMLLWEDVIKALKNASLFWLFKCVSTVAQSTRSGSFSLSRWDTACWIATSGKIWIFTLLNLLKDFRLIYNKYYSQTLLLCIWVFSDCFSQTQLLEFIWTCSSIEVLIEE